PVVEHSQRLVDRFVWTPRQMGRDPFLESSELALVEEAQPRRQERDDCRGLMNSWRERGGRPRFIVVFQEAGQFVLVIEARVEMLAHRPGMMVAEAVVESFVVGVVETLLLQGPFQVPVDLGHEQKARNPFAHALGSLWPKQR